MNKIGELNPDAALAFLLDKNVKVFTSASQHHAIRAYADGERPNNNLGDEFIEIVWNGGARSLTEANNIFKGNLAIKIWCKTQADGRAKKKIVNQIVSQLYPIVNRIVSHGFIFTFDPSNVITPTTTNLSQGYSTTILNTKWRVTNDFINN